MRGRDKAGWKFSQKPKSRQEIVREARESLQNIEFISEGKSLKVKSAARRKKFIDDRAERLRIFAIEPHKHRADQHLLQIFELGGKDFASLDKFLESCRRTSSYPKNVLLARTRRLQKEGLLPSI